MEIKVHRVSTDHRENKGLRGQLVHQAPTENPEDQVHQVSTETQAHRVTQAPLVYQAHQEKVFQALQVLPVLMVNQDPEVTMVNPVQPVIQVPQDHLAKAE